MKERILLFHSLPWAEATTSDTELHDPIAIILRGNNHHQMEADKVNCQVKEIEQPNFLTSVLVAVGGLRVVGCISK